MSLSQWMLVIGSVVVVNFIIWWWRNTHPRSLTRYDDARRVGGVVLVLWLATPFMGSSGDEIQGIGYLEHYATLLPWMVGLWAILFAVAVLFDKAKTALKRNLA